MKFDSDRRQSWDQSVYLQAFFDNRYGPAKPLIAPAEPGAYEIVYLFSELYDADAKAARVPLLVGDGALLEEAALDTETDMQTAALSDDIVYSCAAPVCMITDPATGLSFALPQGWFTDQPTLQSATAGGQPGNPRVTFMHLSGDEIDTIVLNPHQWIAMNGPCMEVPMGQLCQFEGKAADPTMAAILAQTLQWDGAGQQDAAAGHSPDDDPLRAQSVFDCTGETICTYEDPEAQFVTVIPVGWSVTAATRGATRNRDGRFALNVTFFSKMEVPDLIVVNPVGWSDADGPCMDIQAGQLCRTEPGSDLVLPAFDMISRALRDTAPRELPSPAEALATVMNDIVAQDPDAAAAMGALLGTAQTLERETGAALDDGGGHRLPVGRDRPGSSAPA